MTPINILVVTLLSSFSKIRAFQRPCLLGYLQNTRKGVRVVWGACARGRLPTAWLWSHPQHFLFLVRLEGPVLQLSCGVKMTQPLPVWHSNASLTPLNSPFPSLQPRVISSPKLPSVLFACPTSSQESCLYIWHPSVTELNTYRGLHRFDLFTYLNVTT